MLFAVHGKTLKSCWKWTQFRWAKIHFCEMLCKNWIRNGPHGIWGKVHGKITEIGGKSNQQCFLWFCVTQISATFAELDAKCLLNLWIVFVCVHLWCSEISIGNMKKWCVQLFDMIVQHSVSGLVMLTKMTEIAQSTSKAQKSSMCSLHMCFHGWPNQLCTKWCAQFDQTIHGWASCKLRNLHWPLVCTNTQSCGLGTMCSTSTFGAQKLKLQLQFHSWLWWKTWWAIVPQADIRRDWPPQGPGNPRPFHPRVFVSPTLQHPRNNSVDSHENKQETHIQFERIA